jgi:hypothetical protein
MKFRALLLHAVVIALALPAAFAHAGEAPPSLVAARKLQAEKRMVQSDSLCRAAVEELSRTPIRDSLLLAEALQLRSYARLARGVYTDSIGFASIERAWEIRRRLNDPSADDASQMQILRMNWRMLQGKGDSAEVILRSIVVARTARAAPRDTILPEALRGLAFVKRDRGDVAGALATFDSARTVRRRVRGNDRIGAQMLSEIGRLLRLQGSVAASRESLQRAISEIEAIDGVGAPTTATLIDYLASTERDAGNLMRAIDLSQEGVRRLKAATPPDETEIARLRRNMAGWMIELDDLPGARALLEDVLPAYRSMYGDKHWRVASVLASLGSIIVNRGDSTALGYLREAEAIRRARPGPVDPELARIYHSQATWQLTQQDWRGTVATCERGLAAATSNPPLVRIVTGQLHALRVRALALGTDTTGLALACDEMDHAMVTLALDSSSVSDAVHLARSYARTTQGRDAEAWSEAVVAQASSHERALASARTLSDQYALLRQASASEALDRLFALAPSGSSERLAFAWDRLVRARGLVRAELARRHPPAALRADTAIVASLERWTEAQRLLARATLALGSDRSASARASWEELRAEAAERERLHARTLAERGGRAPASEPTLEGVRAALAPGEALVSMIELFGGTDSARVVALVARSGDGAPVRVELGASAALQPDVSAWKSQLARWPSQAREGAPAAERACRRAGERVRARTWDRLAPALVGATTVWLVGDGPLASLPWQALPMRDGRWFAESGPLLRLPLAERELLERASANPAATLFAIGAPDFGAGATGVARAGAAPCENGAVPLDSAARVAARGERRGARVARNRQEHRGAARPRRDRSALPRRGAGRRDRARGDARHRGRRRLRRRPRRTSRRRRRFADRTREAGRTCGAAREGCREARARRARAAVSVDRAPHLARALRSREARAVRVLRRRRTPHRGGSRDARPFGREVGRAVGVSLRVFGVVARRRRARHAPRVRARGRARRDRERVGRRGRRDAPVDGRAARRARPRRRHGGVDAGGEHHRAARTPRRAPLDPPVLLGRLHRERGLEAPPVSRDAGRGSRRSAVRSPSPRSCLRRARSRGRRLRRTARTTRSSPSHDWRAGRSARRPPSPTASSPSARRRTPARRECRCARRAGAAPRA